MNRIHIAALLVLSQSLLTPRSLAASPPNDQFANAIALTGTHVVVSGTTRGASTEPWEAPLGLPPSSVWWSWTAPADGTVALEAKGATWPVALAALNVVAPGSPANVSGTSRWIHPSTRTSRLSFQVAQGLVYAIAAGNETAVAGGESELTLDLTWWPRPVNDAFADRARLAGSEVTEQVVLAGATAEPWEQNHRDWFYDLAPFSWLNPPTAWWEWRAPVSGAVTVSLVDDVGAVGPLAAAVSAQAALAVTVLAGPEPAQLHLVGRAAAWGPPYVATIPFEAVAGATYQIALQASTFPNDPHTLRIRYGQPPRVMLTQPLHGTEWRVGQTVPLQAHAISPDGAVRQVEFQLAQNYDGFTPFATNAPGSFTAIWRPTQSGEYRVLTVAVDDRETRSVSFPVLVQVRPENDAFANRPPIPATAFDVAADLANATQEAPWSDGPDVWWSWTAPQQGTYSIEATCEPGYWPRLAVFTGDALDRLTLVASNAFAGTDNTFLARVTFAAEAGIPYALRLSANAFQTRLLANLHIVPSAPPTVALIEPPHGASFTNNAPVVLSAAATDPDDGVARVEFLLNNEVVGTATQPPYEVTIGPQPGPMGYWYTARAVDHFGLVARSETRMIYFYPPVVPPQPPPNDNFAERAPMAGSVVTVRGTTSNATREPDEPGPGYGSIWWSWTPDRSGYHTLELASQGRNHVSLFDGAPLAALKLLSTTNAVTFGDPGNPAFEHQFTRLAVAVEAGQTYAIAVAAELEAEVGTVTLNVFPGVRPEVTIQRAPDGSLSVGDSIEVTAQASDLDGQVAAVGYWLYGPTADFTRTTNLTASPYRVTLTDLVAGSYIITARALDDSQLNSDYTDLEFSVVTPPPANADFSQRTRLTGAPLTATGSFEGLRVWCSWTPSASGDYTVTLTSEPCCLPRLSVYRGSVESQLEFIGENVSTGFDNDTYSTRVTFFAEASVEYAFSLSAGTFGAGYEVRVNPSQPPAARITQPVAGVPVRGAESFTIVADASDPEGRLARVDLYVDNTVVASFTQPPFRVVVPITQTWWEGRRVRALATDADGLQTWSASVWAEVYPPPPANDAFANAARLSGLFTDARCQVAGASREPGEPAIAAAAENGSAWYAWTAPADGQVLVMLGADYISAGLYEGTSVAALTPVAVSPVGAARQLVARVAAGTTYYLAVEASARWPNEFTLNLLLLPDPRGTLTASVGEDGWFLMQGLDFPAGVQVLEVSGDLRTWTPVQTNTAPAFDFREPIDRGVPQRFYRLVTHPSP